MPPAPPAPSGAEDNAATGAEDKTDNASSGSTDPFGQQSPSLSYGAPAGYPGYAQEASAPSAGQPSGYPAYGQQAPASPYSQPQGYPGYPAYGQDGYPQPRPNPGQAMGIAGLITSFFLAVVGLVLSIVGLNQSRKAGMSNTPAVIGIVVGSLGTLVTVVFIIISIVVAMSTPYYY